MESKKLVKTTGFLDSKQKVHLSFTKMKVQLLAVKTISHLQLLDQDVNKIFKEFLLQGVVSIID